MSDLNLWLLYASLTFIQSFLSLPLVGLQSLVAWQYNNIGGFGTQKTILHNICTYVLRLDLMIWLATSVAGLVVAAQQVYCLPEGTDATFWRVGISCAFHRASVIVAVVSMYAAFSFGVFTCTDNYSIGSLCVLCTVRGSFAIGHMMYRFSVSTSARQSTEMAVSPQVIAGIAEKHLKTKFSIFAANMMEMEPASSGLWTQLPTKSTVIPASGILPPSVCDLNSESTLIPVRHMERLCQERRFRQGILHTVSHLDHKAWLASSIPSRVHLPS